MFKVGDKAVYLNERYVDKLLTIEAVSPKKGYPRRINNGVGNIHTTRFEVRPATPQEIAAGHRIDKSQLMQHLDKCEEVVKTWPKWKLQSVRDAFGIPVLDNDMGDDSHIENHISPNCKVVVK